MLEWHGNSPELTSIENLCSIMNNKVMCKQPSTAPNLKHAVKDIWITGIAQDYRVSLVYGMITVFYGMLCPIQEVINRKRQ